MKKLYDDMLSSLEKAKATEINDIAASIKHYAIAIDLMKRIINIEPDSNKKAFIQNELVFYETKIRDLQMSNRSSTSSRNSQLSNKPSEILAKEYFASAMQLDEQITSNSTTVDVSIVDKCIHTYLSAAEAFKQVDVTKNRTIIDGIITRIDALKTLQSQLQEMNVLNMLSSLPSIPQGDIKLNTQQSGNNNHNTSSSSSSSSSGNYNNNKIASNDSKLNDTDIPMKTASDIGWITANKYSNTTSSNNNNNNGNNTIEHTLTEKEIQVLKTSSIVNGKVYMPWLPGEEEHERFRYDHIYNDPDGLLPLSEAQIKAGAIWKRPSDVIIETKPIMIQNIDPMSIRQHLVSDCSFVCSLCIASAYEAKFKKKLITSIIYPQNNNYQPIYNAYGKYMIKLHINGVPRKIIVDDKLPYNPNTGLFACSSSIYPHELWISIIEKAYMKVNGGYDFPGSNSDIDLYALTGWIPEHIFFQDDEDELRTCNTATNNKSSDNNTMDKTDKIVIIEEQNHTQSSSRAWERIKSAHKFGDCLITIGTGALTQEEETSTGLVPGHAYAVLDVKEAGILKMLKVKNPWSSHPWRGPFSSADRGRWTVGLMKALGVTSAEEFDMMEKNGIFWIEFKDCRKYFPGYYLNWNPALFNFHTVLHDTWPLTQGPAKDTYFIGENPQYCLIVDCLGYNTSTSSTSNNNGGGSTGNSVGSGSGSGSLTQTVWVLLSRHYADRNAKTRGHNKSNDDNAEAKDFLAVHVHCIQVPRRLYGSAVKSIQGVYTDGVHTLIRIDIDTVQILSDEEDLGNGDGSAQELFLQRLSKNLTSHQRAFNLVVSQRNRTHNVNYTMNVYSTVPFKFYEAPPSPPHKIELQGKWTPMTCGLPTHVTFPNTPQYRLMIPMSNHPMHIHIQILFPKEVHGRIYVCLSGERLSDVDEKDKSKTLLTSGKYRPGYCCCEGYLNTGSYSIILSTYEAEVNCKYIFAVRGSNNTYGLVEIR